MNCRRYLFPFSCAVLYPAFMALVETVWQPGYLYKSLVKLALTVLLVGIACALQKKTPQEMILLHRIPLPKTLLLVMAVMFAGVFAGFLLLRNQLDLALIRERLMQKEGLTKANCLLIFGYIILVNSFLEEAFFRGFLGHAFPQPWGMAIGSLSFAVYHIGILNSWMHPGMLLLMTAGLAAVGAVLHSICDRFGGLPASWLVHGCTNLAINAIGFAVLWEL